MLETLIAAIALLLGFCAFKLSEIAKRLQSIDRTALTVQQANDGRFATLNEHLFQIRSCYEEDLQSIVYALDRRLPMARQQ